MLSYGRTLPALPHRSRITIHFSLQCINSQPPFCLFSHESACFTAACSVPSRFVLFLTYTTCSLYPPVPCLPLGPRFLVPCLSTLSLSLSVSRLPSFWSILCCLIPSLHSAHENRQSSVFSVFPPPEAYAIAFLFYFILSLVLVPFCFLAPRSMIRRVFANTPNSRQ